MSDSKRYKVVGTQPVLGNAPGQTFIANVDQAQEDFWVQVGAVKVVGGRKPKKD